MTVAHPPPYYDPPTMPFSQQRSKLRAAVGRLVGEKLDSTRGTWRLGCSADRHAQLYIRENFLSADEYIQVCEQIDAGVYPSPLYEKEKYDGVRTSQSCDLNASDPVVAEVEARIAEMLGTDPAWGEPLQGQRYEPDRCFKEHADFFYIDQPYWAEYEPLGCQHNWTAMIYLNKPAEGGATGFRYLNLSIEPNPARILVWNNMAGDGSLNPWTIHEGHPVLGGLKYIVTKWYRERAVL